MKLEVKWTKITYRKINHHASPNKYSQGHVACAHFSATFIYIVCVYFGGRLLGVLMSPLIWTSLQTCLINRDPNQASLPPNFLKPLQSSSLVQPNLSPPYLPQMKLTPVPLFHHNDNTHSTLKQRKKLLVQSLKSFNWKKRPRNEL